MSLLCVFFLPLQARDIYSGTPPARLELYEIHKGCLRISLVPREMTDEIPENPALARTVKLPPQLSLAEPGQPVFKRIAGMSVEISPDPLQIRILTENGEVLQSITFYDDGRIGFMLGDEPVLGLGEGGPKPGGPWRDLPVEFDRRGRLYAMQPRWQGDAYGSRNPVPLLVGTGGWGLYLASPWVQVDLTGTREGFFVPVKPPPAENDQQDRKNQQLNLGKGIPSPHRRIPGYCDLFVFDARVPAEFMGNVARISGPPVMPPRWAFGYMQSHRTLEDEDQLIAIVDSFRSKQIPLDAVIYLGTGFCPQGWNTPQPSFDFNPEVFKRDPHQTIANLHGRGVKIVLHMVPWDRDRLPTLHGSIPPGEGEIIDSSHISEYWKQHVPLMLLGVDAWWPDEGDWFNLDERLKRHQMYYEGPLFTRPGIRPWSLHRNGYLGIARWGGWIWSGDTQSSWKTLEAQIAVGLNHSLSLSPYWGSDIGGFYPGEELTGELYARWFQFGAFCPSFRAHGRTWWTRLPWGWGLPEMGPLESRRNPLDTELNNPEIEPVCKRYAELRYRLLSYTYTLAWEARTAGMPLMRALWLHYPEDSCLRGTGDEYLWGRDILIAPVYHKGAVSRELYLPAGEWYDWWTGEKFSGGRKIRRVVDLETMPIYIRAGAILPLDPPGQTTGQDPQAPLTVRVYRGTDGTYTLYEDDGISLDYLRGDYRQTKFTWADEERILGIEPVGPGVLPCPDEERVFLLECQPGTETKQVIYRGRKMSVKL